MKLRKLELKDAPLMLEWMHDITVVQNLQANFLEKTIEDCQTFIMESQNTESDIHLAITDEADIYMGTVSLKHISQENAEFAITVRSCAMGKGYAGFGMQRILEFGKGKLGLNAIYWCVSPENIRAVRFYDKYGYNRPEQVPNRLGEKYDEELIWYIYE